MIAHNSSIKISAPVSDVFTFLSHPENIPKWQSEVVSSTVISPGPLRAGTQFEEVVKIFGKKVPTICEVTEYQPTKRLAFRSTSGPVLSYSGEFQFEPNGRATLLTINAHFRLKGMWRLAEPLFGFDVRRAVDNELKTLKSILEK